jgi:hypothetical protein
MPELSMWLPPPAPAPRCRFQQQYSIPRERVLCFIHDRAKVNRAAYDLIEWEYPKSKDFGCFSHTINNAGTCFKLPHLDVFLGGWKNMISRSRLTPGHFKQVFGEAAKQPSETRYFFSFSLMSYAYHLLLRWWSEWEQAKQLWRFWDRIPTFLDQLDAEEVCAASVSKCKEAYTDAWVKLELAALIDAGELLVKTTYHLEGGGLLALDAFRDISAVIEHAHFTPLPLSTAVANEYHAANSHNSVANLKLYVKDAIAPCMKYLLDRFEGPNAPLYEILQIFKGCRLFNPLLMSTLLPVGHNQQALDSVEADLKLIPALEEQEIKDLMTELPIYAAAARDVNPPADLASFWNNSRNRLEHWSKAGSGKLQFINLPVQLPNGFSPF